MASEAIVIMSTQPPPAPETMSVLVPQRAGTAVAVDGAAAATLDGAPAVAVLTPPQGAPAGTGEGGHEENKDEIVVDAAVRDHEETTSCCIAVDPLEAQLNKEIREMAAAAAAKAREEELLPCIAVDPLEAQLNKDIRELAAAAKAREEELLPCISRVHPSIRQQESEDYDPKLVSIGPLHRANTSLHPMEDVKLSYLKDFIIGSCIEEIRECEPRARKYYAEKIGLTQDELVRTLVLDGCFIIGYFLKQHLDRTLSFGGVRWGFSHLLRRDLMLLENQIPFFVLSKLFKRTTRTGHFKSLIDFVLPFLDGNLYKVLPKERYPQEDQVLHLLHLYHLCLDPSLVPNKPYGCSSSSSCNRLLYPIKNPVNSIMFVFLALFYLFKIHKWHEYWCPTEHFTVQRVMIPCAAELLSYGVEFTKNNKYGSFANVSFKEGVLEIPVLRVDESTSSKLRNLIALEQCCPQVGSYLTSYAVLMDNLINTESDVAILKKYGILDYSRGNDEEVAKMFNTLCKGGTNLYYERNSLYMRGSYEVKNLILLSELNAYVDVPHHKWRGSLKITYFNSPWTIISLFAGIVLLILTAVQSYFTVFPPPK